MFRVLASMGLEQAAFVHEVRNLAQSSGVLADALERVAADENDRRKAGALRSLAADAREIRERLRRNAIYLADVTGVEGRRRRGRLKLRERTDRVLGFYERAISRRRIGVANDIADDLETPPMFPAELTAILSNLLGNAVKFAGIEGRLQWDA